MSARLIKTPVFWLACFAVLMMHLGPLISGVQNVLSMEQDICFADELLSEAVCQPKAASFASGEHAAHAMHGHMEDKHLPEWVSKLKMCGYCELLTLNPALVLMLIFALGIIAVCLFTVFWTQADIHYSCLRLYAAPRAPPFTTCVTT